MTDRAALADLPEASDMAPEFAGSYPAHSSSTNAVAVSNLLAVTAVGSYEQNFFNTEFSHSVFFSFRAISDGMASFFHHIADVVSLRSEKQMVEIDTPFNVAFVANFQAFWNWAVNRFPSKSMGCFTRTVPVDMPVTTSINRAVPKNTSLFIWSRRVMRETLNKVQITLSSRFLVAHIGAFRWLAYYSTTSLNVKSSLLLVEGRS